MAEPSRIRGLGAVAAVDVLERACAFGRLDVVRTLYAALTEKTGDAHPFVYEGWALVLALRCAHEDVARELLAHGIDLLAAPWHPNWVHELLPGEEAFTRFALTRDSPGYMRNPMDPTVASEVFRDFHAQEQLAGEPYAVPVELASTCDVVGALAEEGLFETTVYCDLFRAALVRAWHALRGGADDADGEACLTLCHQMLELHHAHMADPRWGDERMTELASAMIVPRGSLTVDEFVCVEEPAALLTVVAREPWLAEDTALLRHLAGLIDTTRLSKLPAPLAGLRELLCSLAAAGDLEQARRFAALPQAGDEELRAALDAASAAGTTEVAAWLLAHLDEQSDPLADLLF